MAEPTAEAPEVDSEERAPVEGVTGEEAASAGRELERIAGTSWLERRPVFDLIPQRQIEVLKRTVAVGASNAELAMFLEIAASLDLNPFTHEIWCIVSQRDGGPRRILMMVGRDGLLKNARRHTDYLGYDSAVVREKDHYQRVAPDAEGKTLRERAGIVHVGEGFGDSRGKILGAWCAVERAGQPPRVFEAPLSEYFPTSKGKAEHSPWGSAVSVMIEKVALSVAHRTSFDLAGVLGEGEEARILLTEGSADEAPLDSGAALLEAVVGLGLEPELADELFRLASEINELERDLWNPARIQMTLMGQPPERVAEEVVAMRAELEKLRERAEAEEPADAEVVEEPAPAPAEAQEAIDALLARGEELEGRLAAAEPASEEFDALSAELDSVTAELEALRGQ